MLEALIPFLKMPEYTLVEYVPLLKGPIKLQVFGPLVATGVIVGWHQCLRYAAKKDMDQFLVRDLMFWILVSGFAVAHWVSVLFYFPEQVREDPWVLLAFTNGLSSVGGFIGAVLGMVVFLRKHKQPIVPFADLLVFGLLIGWCFGRLGCSLVHDHPGRIADPNALMAVGEWASRRKDGTWHIYEGVYRYDLGLNEFLFAVVMTSIVYFLVDWGNKKPGFIVGLVATAYAPFRFAMDFLRADASGKGVGTPDVRYAGLTTAQWVTVAFFLAGLYLLFRKEKPEDKTYAKESDRVAEEAEAAKRKAEARADEDDDDDDDDDDPDDAAAGSTPEGSEAGASNADDADEDPKEGS